MLTTPPTERAPPLNVLTFDSGDVKGLSALLVFRDIMNRVYIDRQAPQAVQPCDYFDLIGGTGIKGIIALILERLHMAQQRYRAV